MRLFNSYARTFSKGYTITPEVYGLAKTYPSLNGLYLALPDYVQDSKIGVFGASKVLTWYNSLQDTNYLYSVTDNPATSPTLIESDAQFNNQPCVDFPDEGNTALRFKFPVVVGTMFVVYMTRDSSAYLVYAPRETNPPSQNDKLYYDAFPPGPNGTLWGDEVLNNNNSSVFLSNTRINKNPVTNNVFVVEGSARLLTVYGFNRPDGRESISGFGGRSGDIGGRENKYAVDGSKSVAGKIAAIVTFEDVLTVEQIRSIEDILSDLYINYSGIVLTTTPALKAIVNEVFAFDFVPVTLDEFYPIDSWNLIGDASDIGLSFIGGVLQGTPTYIYESDVIIRITNTNGDVRDFNVPLLVCHKDPIVPILPQLGNIVLVLSSSKDAIDGGSYGIKSAPSNELIYWDDARRLANKTLNRVTVSDIVQPAPTYLASDALFAGQPVVSFAFNNRLELAQEVTGRTFLWVYLQTANTPRQMLDTFPDIKGNGELWTVPNTATVHGTTPVTSLVTKVHKVPVNTLSYKLPIGTAYFITAKAESGSVNFKGFRYGVGKLAFFCSWSTLVTDSDLAILIASLTERYYTDFRPFIFSTLTEYKYATPIQVDLSTKVIDLRNQTLSYNILTNHNSAVITNNLLDFSASTDETLPFSIQATNTSLLSSTLNFNVEVILRTNPLYLFFRNNFTDFSAFFITLNESIVYSLTIVNTWMDYRGAPTTFGSSNVSVATRYELDNKPGMDFDVDGSDFFTGSAAVSGRCFVFGYIRNPLATGRALLLGQDSTGDFLSGTAGTLWDAAATSSSVLNGSSYVNGRVVSNSYVLPAGVLDVLVINTTATMSFTSIAKDRAFTDRSVKGQLAFMCVMQDNVTAQQANSINAGVRDYYDSPKKVVQLAFDGTLNDSGDRSKVPTGPLSFDTIFKFGGNSRILFNNNTINPVTIPNSTDFAFLMEDFTISLWLYINNAIVTGNKAVLYNQTNLVIFIEAGILYVSRVAFTSGSILSYTLPGSIYSSNIFHQIQLGRKNNVLYLFFNGTLVGSTPDNIEYIDYNTPVVLGQGDLSNTGAIKLLIDDFVVFRRNCLNTTNFILPTSPY